jgi:hypothetical protein
MARDHLHAVAVAAPGMAGAVALDLWARFVAPWLLPYLAEEGEEAKAPLLTAGAADSVLGACQGLLMYISKGLAALRSSLAAPAESSSGATPSSAAGGGGGASALGGQGLPPLPASGEIWPVTTDAYTHEACQAFAELCAAPPVLAEEWLRLHGGLLRAIHVIARADLWHCAHPSLLYPAHLRWSAPLTAKVRHTLLALYLPPEEGLE